MSAREKLTLRWRGPTEPVPDITFVDITDAFEPPAMPALDTSAPTAPPLLSLTIDQQHYQNVLLLLDRWAEWVRTGEPIAEGAPRACLGAPDARIHSFEDMEIEVNKRLVREVHTAIWELDVMEREAVMMHFGLNTRGVWRAKFEQIFEMAVQNLFRILKTRVSC